jgi:hypothetical protein
MMRGWAEADCGDDGSTAVLSGRTAEARNAGLGLGPNFTVARFPQRAVHENPTFLAQRQGPELRR